MTSDKAIVLEKDKEQYKVELDKKGYDAENVRENRILIGIDQTTLITISIEEKITNEAKLCKKTKDLVSSMWKSAKIGDQKVTSLFPSDFIISDRRDLMNGHEGYRFSITSNNNIYGKIYICYLEKDCINMVSIFAFYKENDKNALDIINTIVRSIHIEKIG
jgi:hypothetical protein